MYKEKKLVSFCLHDVSPLWGLGFYGQVSPISRLGPDSKPLEDGRYKPSNNAELVEFFAAAVALSHPEAALKTGGENDKKHESCNWMSGLFHQISISELYLSLNISIVLLKNEYDFDFNALFNVWKHCILGILNSFHFLQFNTPSENMFMWNLGGNAVNIFME